MPKQQARDVMTVFEHVNWNWGMGCPKNQRGLCPTRTPVPAVIGSGWNGSSPARNLGPSLADFSAPPNWSPSGSCQLPKERPSTSPLPCVGTLSSATSIGRSLACPSQFDPIATARLFFQKSRAASARPLPKTPLERSPVPKAKSRSQFTKSFSIRPSPGFPASSLCSLLPPTPASDASPKGPDPYMEPQSLYCITFLPFSM